MPNIQTNKKIILFDGVCNLCNNAVTFVIKRDRKDVFRFASLQSEIGKQLLLEYAINPKEIDSIILSTPDGNIYTKSDAALRIAHDLNGGIKILSIFLMIPKFIRDRIYDFIAHSRYRWFGKKQSCMIPTPGLKNKFLNQ